MAIISQSKKTRVFGPDDAEAKHLIEAEQKIRDEFAKQKEEIEKAREKATEKYWKRVAEVLGEDLEQLKNKVAIQLDFDSKDDGVVIARFRDISQQPPAPEEAVTDGAKEVNAA